jgi:hypothetical protein
MEYEGPLYLNQKCAPPVNNLSQINPVRDKWVPVITAWRVLRLRMEERPQIWRVAENILNKQSQTADNGLTSSFGGWLRWHLISHTNDTFP